MSLLKFTVIFNVVSFHWILKCDDLQHTGLTPDKELKGLIYGLLFYVIIQRSHKLLKTIQFF